MLIRKKIVAICCLIIFGAVSISSVELLSKDQALKRMFLTVESIAEETKTLNSVQLDNVKNSLGGKLWAIKVPQGVKEDTYTFYYGMKGGQKKGVAIIEEQEDKWGLLKFIIVLDPQTGKVTNVAMMKYVDGRSRKLADREYLNVYFNKGINNQLMIGKDINAVSGATVSSGVLCFIVKKVCALYKEVYLKK